MKYLLITAAFSAAIAASGVAKADTINFSQFTGTLGSSITGTTEAGDAVTIAGPGNFQLLVQGTSWGGNFNDAAPVLFDGGQSGAVTLSFGTGLSSMTLAGQANDFGSYTETATAYSGDAVVDTENATAASSNDPGTVPYLTVTGTDITSIVFTTTDDSGGFAIYGGSGATVDDTSVPEPASMTILGLGLMGTGLARRRRRV